MYCGIDSSDVGLWGLWAAERVGGVDIQGRKVHIVDICTGIGKTGFCIEEC